MNDKTDRELRYEERERRQHVEEQMQALHDLLRRQRESTCQQRAEPGFGRGLLSRPSSDPTDRAPFGSLQSHDRRLTQTTDVDHQPLGTSGDHTFQRTLTGQDRRPRLDYAGKLPTPNDSFDDADSQYSDTVFARHNNTPTLTVTDRQQQNRIRMDEGDSRTGEGQTYLVRQSKEDLTHIRNIYKGDEQTDRGTLNPALDYPGLTDNRSTGIHDTAKSYEPETGCSNEEEGELIAWLKELQFQERRIQEDRKRKQDAERALEMKLKALKQKDEEVRRESERKERLKALKLEAQRIQARLYEEEEEDKRCQDRMERMYQETKKLEQSIAQEENRNRQSFTRDRSETSARERNIETEKRLTEAEIQKPLEEELKRRELLIKQEMEDDRRRNRSADEAVRQKDSLRSYITEEEIRKLEAKDRLRQREEAARYKEQTHYRERELPVQKDDRQREAQRSQHLEEELRQKEIELERKEEMLRRLQRQLDGQESGQSAELLRRKTDIEKKERYLNQLEQQLKDRESQVKTNLKTETEDDKVRITHLDKTYLSQFSGADPTPKNESSFEAWKAEAECLKRSKVYPEYIVTQAIRNSLKGQARKILATLDPLTNSDGIISKLESLFGNVASGLSVLQEFFTAVQADDECVSMWGLRLEELIQRAISKGEVTPERKNHLLKEKFWSSLQSLELKVASKVHFDSCTDFEVLRSKVREEEKMLQTHRATFDKTPSSIIAVPTPSAVLQHQPVQTSTGPAKKVDDLSKRVENIEKFCFSRKRFYPKKNKDNDRQTGQQQQGQQQQIQQQQGSQQQQQQQSGQNNADTNRTNNRTNNLNKDKPPLQGK